jgi:hypothetical protein
MLTLLASCCLTAYRFSMDRMSNETHACPRCGAAFACKAGTAEVCPCSKLPFTLTREAIAQLENRYGSCLCLSCLQTLHEELPPAQA